MESGWKSYYGKGCWGYVDKGGVRRCGGLLSMFCCEDGVKERGKE